MCCRVTKDLLALIIVKCQKLKAHVLVDDRTQIRDLSVDLAGAGNPRQSL